MTFPPAGRRTGRKRINTGVLVVSAYGECPRPVLGNYWMARILRLRDAPKRLTEASMYLSWGNLQNLLAMRWRLSLSTPNAFFIPLLPYTAAEAVA